MSIDGQPETTHVPHTIAPADATPPADLPSLESAGGATPDPTPTGPEPPAIPSFRDEMTRRGVDVTQFADDGAAYDYVAGQAAIAVDPQFQQLAQFGQQVIPQYDKFQEFLKSQEAPPEPAPEPESFFGPVPDWNPEDEKRLWTNPESGQVEIRREHLQSAHPQLPQRYEEHQRAKRDNLQKMLDDPYGAVQDKVSAAIDAKFAEYSQQQTEQGKQQYAQQEAVQLDSALLADPRNELLEFDGAQMKLGAQGQMAFTPRGTAYAQFRDYLLNSNVPPAQAPMLALQMVLGYQAPEGNGSQLTSPPPSPGEAARQQFLQPGYMGDRGGSIDAAAQPSGPPQNPEMDFEQLHKQVAAEGQHT